MDNLQGTPSVKLNAALSRAEVRILQSHQVGVCEYALTITDTDPPLDVFVMVIQSGGAVGEAVTVN